MGNRWKTAFFALLVFLAALTVALFVAFQHYLPAPKKTDFAIEDELNSDKPIFTVSTNKQQLQALVNEKLTASNEKENVRYKIEMKDELAVKGAVVFLGNDISFSMTLHPKVTTSGNIILEEKSIRLGSFNLPVSRVLQYIKKSGQLPDWVTILPKKEEIHVALDDIQIENQFYLQAEQFDLEENDMTFSIYK